MIGSYYNSIIIVLIYIKIEVKCTELYEFIKLYFLFCLLQLFFLLYHIQFKELSLLRYYTDYYILLQIIGSFLKLVMLLTSFPQLFRLL